MHDVAEADEGKRSAGGRNKGNYYNADTANYEIQSSDEELPAEEEVELTRTQKGRAKSLSVAEFGLENDVILVKGKAKSKPPAKKGAQDETGTSYEEVKNDFFEKCRADGHCIQGCSSNTWFAD